MTWKHDGVGLTAVRRLGGATVAKSSVDETVGGCGGDDLRIFFVCTVTQFIRDSRRRHLLSVSYRS